jgi:peptide subunit release factor 1 (eRF1)
MFINVVRHPGLLFVQNIEQIVYLPLKNKENLYKRKRKKKEKFSCVCCLSNTKLVISDVMIKKIMKKKIENPATVAFVFKHVEK